MVPHYQRLLLPLALTALASALQTECPWDPAYLFAQRNSSLPVDDSDELADSLPWTNEPYCLRPRSIGSDETFCVYSSSVFNENSGISLITTPDIAASLVEAIQRPTAAWENRRDLAGQKEPEYDENGFEVELPYEVVEIPGRGMGVVATRKIKQFDVIMVSYPAMIADNAFFPPEEEMTPTEGPRLFQRALDQLGNQERFLNLAQSMGGDVHVVEDVIRTNAFGLYLNGKGHKGLYPEIAVS